ncbi:U32 family peptidase domain protein [[Clostridium] sordellii ATCC 9714]|nr:U32 family peptidase domain protein [[Clostridium] sordellii ATCC 9714] [Paeniclostridium sordellii ATCC 9714]
MFVGDEIEIIGPYKETMYATILEMYNEDGEPIESAPHAKQIVKMKLDIEVEENYMLRKPITSINVL